VIVVRARGGDMQTSILECPVSEEKNINEMGHVVESFLQRIMWQSKESNL